jgi:hypothetical protein
MLGALNTKTQRRGGVQHIANEKKHYVLGVLNTKNT